jgi:hypothetical protein
MALSKNIFKINLYQISIIKNSITELKKFRDERDWNQFHNPKDLAIAISIESSELFEEFLWKSHHDENIGNMVYLG